MPDEKKRVTAEEVSEEMVPEVYAHRMVRTLSLKIDDGPGRLGAIATVIGETGALVGDVTRDRLGVSHVFRRVTVYVSGERHLDEVIAKIRELGGVEVLGVIDEVLSMHEGGKIEIAGRVRISGMEDLGKIYTPGVAGVCRKIERNGELARKYTWISNTVAIVTNGTAVLGLGDIGPLAGLPVMEGKSLILKEFGGVNCVPILVDTKDAGELVETVERIHKGFGLIMLEDIAAPVCFEVEEELDRRLAIPVFHDDQHGTAVVALAGLMNALRQVGKAPGEISVLLNGAGAAGTAIALMLVHYGVKDLVVLDRGGAIYEGRKGNTAVKEKLGKVTNRGKVKGGIDELLEGRDVFIGVSRPGALSKETAAKMREGSVIFALANPEPEITLADAVEAGAAVAMDGRSMNNALAFPGIMRGTLDSGASRITAEMKLAAARAIAESATGEALLPNLLDATVHRRVAEAVEGAATRDQVGGRGG